MKVLFSNIEWDTDGEENLDLPESVILEVDSTTDLENEGADVLSDKYGYCVFSFDFTISQ